MSLKVCIYNDHLWTFGGGEKSTFDLALSIKELVPDSQIDIMTWNKPPSKKSLEDYFGMPLGGVQIVHIKKTNILARFFSDIYSSGFLKNICTGKELPSYCRDYDLFINHSYGSFAHGCAKKNIYFCMFPIFDYYPKWSLKTTSKIFKSIILHLLGRDKFLSGYDMFWANSKFTEIHIRKRWGVNNTMVLYPNHDHEEPFHQTKEKKIVSLGRFNPKGHNKRQDILIEAFKRLTKEKGLKDFELHLIGGCDDSQSSTDFLSSLKKTGEGYPIFFHVNCDVSLKAEILRDAVLYWHAAGYEVDERSDPEKLEHFGISIVEAMGFSCFPVVLDAGGVKEIIENNESGMLFRTIDELIETSHRLLSSPEYLKKLREKSYERSREFNKKAFGKRFKKLFQEIMG